MKKIVFIFLSCLCFSLAKEVYDAQRIADTFVKLNGDKDNPKAKVNHAKGFCATASFKPENGITKIIDIPMFKQGSIPTEIRYSLGGAVKDDKSKTRGMALKMKGKSEEWTMVMLNTEINFAKNPKEFVQFFEARLPVKGKIDHKKIAKLTKEVASFRNFAAYTDKMGISRSVANTDFHSIHTFYVKDKKSSQMQAIRWKFVPVDGVKYLSKDEEKSLGKDFLKDDFVQRLEDKKPVAYDMYLVYANEGDATDDTTALWQGEHKELLVGRLTVNKYDGLSCDSNVYFPQDIPAGVDVPKDPLFDIRNEAYAITFGLRQ